MSCDDAIVCNERMHSINSDVLWLRPKNQTKLQWFNDSAEDIRSCCDKALQALRANYGWQVRPAAGRGWLWLIQFDRLMECLRACTCRPWT